MVKASVINGRSIARKLVTLVHLGMAAAAIYGTSWVAPRAINQYRLDSQMAAISKTVDAGDYDGALKSFERVSGEKFLFPNDLKEERAALFKHIRTNKMTELEGMVKASSYVSASKFLAQLRGQEFFSTSDISNLEASVSSVSPKNIIKQADEKIMLPANQVQLYLLAERELGKAGEQDPTLRTKIASASLKDIGVSYGEKKSRDSYIKIDRLNAYLKSKKDSGTQVGTEELNAFFDASGTFMTKVVLDGKADQLGRVKDYLAKVDSLAVSMGIADREQRIGTLAQSAIKQTVVEMGSQKQYQADDIARLDSVVELSQLYSPRNLTDAIDLYLVAHRTQKDATLASGLLDCGLMHTELLPTDRQKEVRIKFADAYSNLARQTNGVTRSGSYMAMQTARRLYLDSGLPKTDKRLGEVDGFIRSNLTARVGGMK